VVKLLTTGPAAVLGSRAVDRPIGLIEGQPADLVVFDRSASWTVSAESLASNGRNSPLVGQTLSGRVLVTLASGRIAHEAAD
jgi:dihydroorotase